MEKRVHRNLKPLLHFRLTTKRRLLELIESGIMTYKDDAVFCGTFVVATIDCAISPGLIAIRLGVKPETVASWTAGLEAPDVYFVRFMAIQGLRDLLIDILNGTETIRPPALAIVKERLAPEVVPGGGAVIDLDSFRKE